MVHLWPPGENDLHETDGTLCECDPEMEIREGGEMYVVHKSFECAHLLIAAELIKDAPRLPILLPFLRKRRGK